MLSRSHVMKDALSSLGGGATWLGECFLKQAFTTPDHCDDGRHRVVSSVGWKRYGVSLPAVSHWKASRYASRGSVSKEDIDVMLGP